MLASILSRFAQLNQSLLNPVHSTIFPFPWITTIHATRVSLTYRTNVQRVSKLELQEYQSNGEVGEKPYRTWLMDIIGFLVMAWGGSFISNYLVHSTPPQFLTIQPLIQYLIIHILITLIFQFIPLSSLSILDTILPLLDGSTRAASLTGGLTLASKHSPSPLTLTSENHLLKNSTTSSSFILPLILGTVSTSFGGQIASTLNIFSSNWSIKTLPILKSKDLISSIDVLSPLIASLFHGLFNSYHPVYMNLRILLGLNEDGEIVLGLIGAKALVSLIISLAFFCRALGLHWLK